MASVLAKTVFSKNVPLIKCMKGRTLVFLANRKNPNITAIISEKKNFIKQQVNTLMSWPQTIEVPVVVKTQTSHCLTPLARSASHSTIMTRRTINDLRRARSFVNLNSLKQTPVITSPSPINQGRLYTTNVISNKGQKELGLNRKSLAAPQQVSYSFGPKKDQTEPAPSSFCSMGPCNCPWPGGCAPPGFCNSGNASNACAGTCGCPTPCMGPPCNVMPCPMCGACGPMVQCGSCGPMAQCGACGPCGQMGQCGPCGPIPQCGACGPAPFSPYGPCPPCAQPQCCNECGGSCGGPCCGTPCPFPCPCSPSGPCGMSGNMNPKKKKN